MLLALLSCDDPTVITYWKFSADTYSTNKSTVVLLCVPLPISCYMFRQYCHRHVADTILLKLVCMYIGFKTSFYVVRHLDSIASYVPTGLHLGFFRSWPSLYLPSSFSSIFLVLSFVSASTSVLFRQSSFCHIRKRNNTKNAVQTIQNTVNTSKHITKTSTHYKTPHTCIHTS